MDLYGGLMNLVKVASLLRGDPRSAYLVNEMQNERNENRIREQIYGAPQTKERDGTEISWNGARAMPTGNVTAMMSQHEALPPVPTRRFLPEVQKAGLDERKQQLMQLPQYQKLAEQQMFALPKPPTKLGANEKLIGDNFEVLASNMLPEKGPEPSELARYQAELDAMSPGDPRRGTWQAKIKRLAEGEPKEAKTIDAPAGYRWAGEPGKSNLVAIPGGPADKPKDDTPPPAGYRKTADGRGLEPIPGGPADIGQKGLPQAYKDQKAAFDTMDATIAEYKKLLKETGTEYWDTTKATRLKNLQTQMMLSMKDIAKTGSLDNGTMAVMEGLIPDATGFLANLKVTNGAERAMANVDELSGYVARGRAATDKAYGGQVEGQAPPEGGRQYIGFTPEGKRVYVENGQQYVED